MKKIDKNFIELNHGLSKSKINEFIKSLYNMKIQKNVFAPKIKRLKKAFTILRSIMMILNAKE